MAAFGASWAAVSYAYAAVVAGIIGWFLYDIPIQVTDSYGNLVQASGGTLGSLVEAQLHQKAFLRPMLWGLIRVVYDLSGGDYFAWFRGWHVAQVVALTLLFVRLLAPATLVEAAVAPVGLAALVGMHTFTGTVVEAFPINTYMTILLCCLLAAVIALGPRRWWRDWAVCAVLVFAALTLESGLLVAVIVVTAWAAGARGVSTWGAASVALLTVGYLFVRFVVLGVGSPDLYERSSGFGFTTLDPPDLAARFGANPWPFYAYNVATSFLSVLFAEPRAGTWNFVGHLRGDGVSLVEMAGVAASTLGTLCIAHYAWSRRAAWRARTLDRGDRLVLLFLTVSAGNAVMSYAYTKDVIMSPAGVFFALALAVALRQAIVSAPAAWTPRAAAVAALLVVVSSTWAIRAVGLHAALRTAGTQVRDEWAYIEPGDDRDPKPALEPRAARLREALQADAIWRHPARPVTVPLSAWFND